jgi:SAM-dependent methyltransferase
MASDWRIVPEPLARVVCEGCGLARREPSAAAGQSLYASGYALYAHAPGATREAARQEEYARWIVRVAARSPARVLDVGCGNGSLLVALREHWPHADLLGCDPSAESVAHGATHGLQLWQGTANEAPEGSIDLVITVNVIEHTTDPVAFLAELRRALTADGRAIVVCPDGSTPNLELLFADHLFSLSVGHLAMLMNRAGLTPLTSVKAPHALGAFHMVVAQRDEPTGVVGASARVDVGERRAYLERWQRLDASLLERITGPAVCFGAGEAAGLLRAYAPRTWQRIRACTADDVAEGRFGTLAVIPLDDVPPEETVLVGVRPSDQARVAERLRHRFARVVTWYDLVA